MDLLKKLREQRKAKQEERAKALEAVEERGKTAGAEAADAAEKRGDPKDKVDAARETARAAAAFLTPEEDDAVVALTGEIRALDERIEEVLEEEIREMRSTGRAVELLGATGGARVKREPMTYDRHKRGQSYFRDLGLAMVGGDQEARARLAQHAQEMDVELPKFEERRAAAFDKAMEELRVGNRFPSVEYRDIGRTDGAGGEFVPPLWLIEEYGELARAGRPFANRCRNIPLPGGTDSISVPRITTGTAVAAQNGDNTAVNEQDMVTNSATGPVNTYAGQQDIALQLLEQSPIMFDEIVFADLTADYNAKLDLDLINGPGTGGRHTGVLVLGGTNAVTYTDASPTVPELYPKLADAIQQVATNRKLPASDVFMHARRWYWEVAALDAQNRPFVVPTAQAPMNAAGVQNDVVAEGPVGSQLGLGVSIDQNIPVTLGAGTEDAIIAARMFDLLLFEGALRTRALPEVGSGTLTVRLQVYAYSAFIPGRQPKAISKITGTGLAAPTF